MEVDHLREFIDLAQTLNFTETANRLHVSQPTLSKHMVALERELGASLFERAPSKVSLTEEGFYFLGTASNIVRLVDEACENIALIASRKPIYVDGRFEDPTIFELISTVTRLCTERNLPPVLFNHSAEKSPLSLLIDGNIDAIIDMSPSTQCDKLGLTCHPLFTLPIAIILEDTHPLANRTQLSIKDLEDATFCQLLWDYYEPGWQQIEDLCLKNGFVPKRVSRPVRSLVECIASPLGSSVMPYPQSAAELRYLETSKKRCIPLTDDDAVFTFCVTYRTDNEKKLAGFIETIMEARELVSS